MKKLLVCLLCAFALLGCGREEMIEEIGEVNVDALVEVAVKMKTDIKEVIDKFPTEESFEGMRDLTALFCRMTNDWGPFDEKLEGCKCEFRRDLVRLIEGTEYNPAFIEGYDVEEFDGRIRDLCINYGLVDGVCRDEIINELCEYINWQR